MKAKYLISVLLLLGVLLALPGRSTAAAPCPFWDVREGSYYYDAVAWAVEQDITTGVSATKFDSDGLCTRAQVITFLWRAAGCPEPETYAMPFRDVSADAYYRKAVQWALETDILEAADSDRFTPDRPATRGEFVYYLHLSEAAPVSIILNPFSDVSHASVYYNAILWAYEQEITTGIRQDMFAPADYCTRAQIVTFLHRAYTNESISDDKTLPDWINATQYGLSVTNSAQRNSEILQYLINRMALSGGTIYIPAGEYKFAENATQAIGSHCIRMRSDVSIVGDGDTTVLQPVGTTTSGLDMFYFNDYRDKQSPIYLENCNFEDFVIDASGTSCLRYTSAGKGFMFNLFRNCHWNNVTVKYTDATGFGMDCPINSSITNCTAIGCGKAATVSSAGASGFGIGFGYAEDESFLISNCKAYDNRVFGFFFEHQTRFGNTSYPAGSTTGFVAQNCEARNNYYNYGGIAAIDSRYEACISRQALKYGFFLENSSNCLVTNCRSVDDREAAFVIAQSDSQYAVRNNLFDACTSYGSSCSVKIIGGSNAPSVTGNTVKNCSFYSPGSYVLHTAGSMGSLTVTGNTTNVCRTDLQAKIQSFTNTNNSWN